MQDTGALRRSRVPRQLCCEDAPDIEIEAEGGERESEEWEEEEESQRGRRGGGFCYCGTGRVGGRGRKEKVNPFQRDSSCEAGSDDGLGRREGERGERQEEMSESGLG